MIERILIAVVILAVIAVGGHAIRTLAKSRSGRLTASLRVPTSQAAGPRLMLFSSAGCAACVTQRRLIEGQHESWNPPVEISYHDAVEESDFASTFGILMVPALVVTAPDGRVVAVKQGLVDEDRLRSLIAAAA